MISTNADTKEWGSPIPFPTGGACVLSVIRFQDGGRRSAVAWSVPKIEYDLLRRNASTNVRKTDLTWLYILHRKSKHTIYVRYFSILLYLLNVQVAPTEKKTSLKLWWRISLNVLSWQDSETRPGDFVIFMLSIIIETENFEVNCLYKTRWDSYPGIGEEKKSFLLKKLTQLFTHLFFLLNIQKQHTESIIYMSSFRMWKNGAYFQ